MRSSETLHRFKAACEKYSGDKKYVYNVCLYLYSYVYSYVASAIYIVCVRGWEGVCMRLCVLACMRIFNILGSTYNFL